MEDNEIPTGAEMAAEFAELEAKEAEGTPPEPVEPSDVTPSASETSPVKPSEPAPVEPSIEDRLAAYEAQQAQYLQVIAQLQAQMQQVAQPKPVPPPPEKELTIEELNELWKKDPLAAMRMAATTSPEVREMRKVIEQFQKAEEQRTEQAFADRVNAQQKAVEAKYADFKPGTPIFNAAYKFVLDNRDWLRQVAESNPSFNVIEHAYKQVAFDMREALVKAQNKKLVDKRAKSGSVKPGGTSPVTPSSGSAPRDAASELAQNGTPVPDSWVEAAEKAFARNF